MYFFLNQTVIDHAVIFSKEVKKIKVYHANENPRALGV